VVEALGWPDEGPGDQEHPDLRQGERERNGASDAGVSGSLRIDVGCHRRRHQGQRDADRLPQLQLAPQVRAVGAASLPRFCGHSDSFAQWCRDTENREPRQTKFMHTSPSSMGDSCGVLLCTSRPAKAFGTSPEFWLNGQLALDLHQAINDKQEIEEIEPILH
jgi:hypothetical protein